MHTHKPEIALSTELVSLTRIPCKIQSYLKGGLLLDFFSFLSLSAHLSIYVYVYICMYIYICIYDICIMMYIIMYMYIYVCI